MFPEKPEVSQNVEPNRPDTNAYKDPGKCKWSKNGRIENRRYAFLQNETKQHFETRDLDGDAEKIQMEAYKVISKEDAKRASRERLLTWLALATMLLLLAWLFGWI
jgi:hypothetical protein